MIFLGLYTVVPSLSSHWLFELSIIWTVEMTFLLEYVCIVLEYFIKDLYVNKWALIIQNFRLSEHTQGPMSSRNGEGTVYSSH